MRYPKLLPGEAGRDRAGTDATLYNPTDVAAHATTATPLQDLAISLQQPANGQSLVVIENQTGAGKTEAALLLAHRMMAAGRARGLFVALPTMATANAMYQRLADAYRVLFDHGETPSLVQAQSAGALVSAARPTSMSKVASVPRRTVSSGFGPSEPP